MKRQFLKGKTIAFLAFIFISSYQASASQKVDDFLDFVGDQFKKAPTNEDKFTIASYPVNYKRLDNMNYKEEGLEAVSASSNPLIVEVCKGLFTGNQINTEKTTPLILAIGQGRLELVKQFLKIIEDVNDDRLNGWGENQPYTPAHMALDPQYPYYKEGVPLKTRLAIIDLLAKKGVDFNKIICQDSKIEEFCYRNTEKNPPLAIGKLNGRPPVTDHKALRARALLYGADPLIDGSSFTMDKISADKLITLAWSDYLGLLKKGVKIKITLAKSVSEVFCVFKKEQLELLQKMPF